MKSNYTGIDPSDAGSKAYTPNCVGGSAIGGNFIDYCNANLGGAQCALIIFEDPCNEIPDLNGCSGTLAFGGSYSSSNTHQFDGMSWDNALYGFLVVNNGVEACLTDLQYERMVTHELTHAYRMGHLNATDYPNQNMNPICCNAINTKDEECMNYAYPAPAPVELISFEARLQANRQVSLLWKTATEKDNAYFSIQHSANGIQFEEIKRVQGAGTNGKEYEWIDTRPLAGINYYLLSQTDLDGTIHHLGIKAVNLENKSLSLNISPNPVMGETLAFGIDIQTEFDGIMEVVNTHGLIISSTSLVLEKGIQRLQQPIGTIPAGIYLLRLINGQQFWTARFLKE